MQVIVTNDYSDAKQHGMGLRQLLRAEYGQFVLRLWDWNAFENVIGSASRYNIDISHVRENQSNEPVANLYFETEEKARAAFFNPEPHIFLWCARRG